MCVVCGCVGSDEVVKCRLGWESEKYKVKKRDRRVRGFYAVHASLTLSSRFGSRGPMEGGWYGCVAYMVEIEIYDQLRALRGSMAMPT